MIRLFNVLKYILIITIIVALSFFVLLIADIRSHPEEIKSVLGYIPMTVVSGSMSPELNIGDLIFVKETVPERINKNDIISFRFEDNRIITHRVVEIERKFHGLRIVTKGDANQEADDWIVSGENLIGVLFVKIPFGGYFVKFMASLKGFVIILVIPLFLLISGELKEVLSDERKKQKTFNANKQVDVKQY